MGLAPDDPRHGSSPWIYSNHGCRCDACRKAWADYKRATNLRVGRTKMTQAEYIAATTKHGWKRYKRGGCRCDICRAAAAAQKRRQRANNAEHYREYWRRRRATKGVQDGS